MGRTGVFLSAALAVSMSCIQPGVSVAGPAKHALLIGISDYSRPAAGSWWDLHSGSDVSAIKKILQTRFGFAEGEIKILTTPEETRRQSIIDAFRTSLIDATKPGDIVYFHYSGHGSQTPDLNGDELDGLDEVLIPSDYVSIDDHSNDILDDTIGALLDELVAKRPASLTLSFDCCFAGTNTRGGRMAIRGRTWQGPKPPVRAGERGEEPKPSGLNWPGRTAKEEFVVIAATRNDQTAGETEDDSNQPMGLLTYAMTKAMAEATPQTTYRDLFDRIGDLMSTKGHDQNPQLEGNADRLLFQGTAVKPERFIPVDVDRRDNIMLKAGSLQGMTAGSTFSLFPPGTKDFKTARPVATAKISAVDATESTLCLDSASATTAAPRTLRSSRAVERFHAYGDNRLRVDLTGAGMLPQGEALIQKVRALPLVTSASADSGRWDVRVGPPTGTEQVRSTGMALGPATIVVERQDGSVIATAEPDGEAVETVRKALEGESRWRFVKGLQNRNPDSEIRTDMRLVPVDVEKDPRGVPVKVTRRLEPKRTPGGAFSLFEGDYFIIELKNTGFRDAFVSVLDLRSDGKIGPLWPDPHVRNDNNLLPRDEEWHTIPLRSPKEPWIFQIESGFLGNEVFKAIATREQTDFSPLLDAELIQRTGENRPLSPLGALLKAATMGHRTDGAALDPIDWGTASVNCLILPALK